MRIRIEELCRGCGQTAVYRGSNKEPHFIITGADPDRLDRAKVAEYLAECDWSDKGSPGWITPSLRCDDFLKGKS
ncbi:MAG: hypothetical protein WCK89_10735 [bacterium]